MNVSDYLFDKKVVFEYDLIRKKKVARKGNLTNNMR